MLLIHDMFNYQVNRERITALAIRYYQWSKRYSAGSILTLGLVFFAVSIFFNRPNAMGIFVTMENVTGITQDVWGLIILLAIGLMRIHINPWSQGIGALIMGGVLLEVWRSVFIGGLTWQGPTLLTFTAVLFMKLTLDEVVERFLQNKVK